MPRCRICGELLLLSGDPHDCTPTWRVWPLLFPSPVLTIQTATPAKAAEEWVGRCHNTPTTVEVEVVSEFEYRSGARPMHPYRFRVVWDTIPRFVAKEIG